MFAFVFEVRPALLIGIGSPLSGPAIRSEVGTPETSDVAMLKLGREVGMKIKTYRHYLKRDSLP